MKIWTTDRWRRESSNWTPWSYQPTELPTAPLSFSFFFNHIYMFWVRACSLYRGEIVLQRKLKSREKITMLCPWPWLSRHRGVLRRIWAYHKLKNTGPMGRRGNGDRESRAQNVDTTMTGTVTAQKTLATLYWTLTLWSFKKPIAFILEVIYLDYFFIVLIERGFPTRSKTKDV